MIEMLILVVCICGVLLVYYLFDKYLVKDDYCPHCGYYCTGTSIYCTKGLYDDKEDPDDATPPG